jgi:transcriptional regulator with XRE-family HTH domain
LPTDAEETGTEWAKMISASSPHSDAATLATNLRRLMAREGLTFDEVVAASGLDERTLRALARGTSNPHARTLHKLAGGLGVSIDEFFRPPGRLAPRRFDRATNSLVESVVAQHQDTFQNWSEAEFDELFSRFGVGGPLTETGVLSAAEAMNAKRDIWRQISVVLESGEAELLGEFVELLFRRVTIKRDLLFGANVCQSREDGPFAHHATSPTHTASSMSASAATHGITGCT